MRSLILLLLGGIAETNDLHLLGQSSVQMKAIRQCGNLGRGWELPKGTDAGDNLTNLMMSQNITAIWLGVQRRKLSKFQWIDGTISKALDPQHTDLGCATLSLERMISSHVCADDTVGFICEYSECPEDMSPESGCINFGKFHFKIICDAQNWYKARIKCRSYGGRLAVLDDYTKINVVVGHLAEKAHKWTCLSFYVGLHCEDWTIYQNGEYEPIDSDKWEENEPSNSHDDCVKLIINPKGEGRWHTANCHTKNDVICQQYNSSNDKNTSTDQNDIVCQNVSREETKCEKVNVDGCTGDEAKIILFTLVMVVCIGTIIVVTYYFVKRYRKKQLPERQENENAAEPTEVLLEPQEEANQQLGRNEFELTRR